jgi:hypothetical protein
MARGLFCRPDLSANAAVQKTEKKKKKKKCVRAIGYKNNLA